MARITLAKRKQILQALNSYKLNESDKSNESNNDTTISDTINNSIENNNTLDVPFNDYLFQKLQIMANDDDNIKFILDGTVRAKPFMIKHQKEFLNAYMAIYECMSMHQTRASAKLIRCLISDIRKYNVMMAELLKILSNDESIGETSKLYGSKHIVLYKALVQINKTFLLNNKLRNNNPDALNELNELNDALCNLANSYFELLNEFITKIST